MLDAEHIIQLTETYRLLITLTSLPSNASNC